MVVDIKSVLICDAVDAACVALLESNGIKVRIVCGPFGGVLISSRFRDIGRHQAEAVQGRAVQ